MKIINKLLLLALAFSLSAALPAMAGNKGLVLVHGTGKQTNAAADYWTNDMVNSVKQGLPNQNLVLVINCDFDQYMWAAAASGCLADQLHPFIVNNNITDLVVETHSNGGNILRWIMSNPASDSRYPAIISAIRWVNALAPSSLGTPLANAAISGNVFEAGLGWLLGYKSDAVRQQQTSWMAYYNANYLLGTAGRPALPKSFYNVVGSDVETSIFDSDSYCGGYSLNLALEITQSYLNSCSDGFLECSSQGGAGSTWFTDKSRTTGGEPLSHNQSRRPCFNLDVILRNDI
jgi:hypothetical protein